MKPTTNHRISMAMWLAGFWLLLLAVPLWVCGLGITAISIFDSENGLFLVTHLSVAVLIIGAVLFATGHVLRKRDPNREPNRTHFSI
jgi:hypothetical protein